MSLDTTLFLAVQHLAGIQLIDATMMVLAGALVYLVPTTLIYLWFTGVDGKKDSLYAFAAAIIGLAVSYGMGLLYVHQQPYVTYHTLVTGTPDNAFPSQHTTVVFAAAWPLFWRHRKRLASLLLAAGILTGFARVYVGAHWPIDIAGGIIASLIGFAAVYVLAPFVDERIERVVDWIQTVQERHTGVSSPFSG